MEALPESLPYQVTPPISEPLIPESISPETLTSPEDSSPEVAVLPIYPPLKTNTTTTTTIEQTAMMENLVEKNIFEVGFVCDLDLYRVQYSLDVE